MKQLTKEEAISFAESGKWKNMSHKEIAQFQCQQSLLCMPFDVYHEAVEKTVGYPVFTHEFVSKYFAHIKADILNAK